MARASQVLSDWVEIPHEPGQRMRFRLIPYRVLEDARSKKLERTLGIAKLMDGVTIDAAAATKAAEAVEDDPTAPYDRATLLCAGIAEWSYEGPVDGNDLDEVTAAWAARRIIELAIPSEKALGKGSSRSTAISATPSATQGSPTS